MDGAEPAGDFAARPRYWRLVVSLMLIYSYASADRAILSLLVDPIKHDLGASDFQMSLLLGFAFAVCYGTCAIPAGHFVDRLNRRRMIAIASVGWAAMTIVCGTATTMTQLFIGRAGVGLMEATLTPAAFSLIRDAVPARSRGLAFSTYAFAPVLGSAASFGGGGVLLRVATSGAFAGVPMLGQLAPWQQTLVVVGLSGLPLSLLLLTFAEPRREGSDAAPRGGMIAGLADACRYIAGHRSFYAPLLVFAAVGAMMSFSHNAWFATALVRRFVVAPQHVGPTLGGIYLVAGGIGLAVGGIVMNTIARRGGSVMSYAIVAVIGTALGTSVACLSPSLTAAYWWAAAGMLFLGISNPAGATKLSQATPPEMIGRISAVYLLVQVLLGQTLGPLAVAGVERGMAAGPSSIALSLVVVQIACAAVAVVCALLLVRHPRGAFSR